MVLVLIVILLIVALGGLPTWQWHSYGWGPSGVVGLVLLMLLLLMLLGRI